jgi:hypothetical protein
MTQQAYDDLGNEVQPVTINTICPIMHADAARRIAAEYLGCSPQDTLTTVINGTHVFCSRPGHTHGLQHQVDYITNIKEDWCADRLYTIDDIALIKTKFCTFVGDPKDILSLLEVK